MAVTRAGCSRGLLTRRLADIPSGGCPQEPEASLAAVEIICPHCNRKQKVAEHRLKETAMCLICEQLITDVYLYKCAEKPPELAIAMKGRLVTDSGSHQLEELESKADAYLKDEDGQSRDVQRMRETTQMLSSGMYRAAPQRKKVSTATKTWVIGAIALFSCLALFAVIAWQVIGRDNRAAASINTAADNTTRIEKYDNGMTKAEWGIKRGSDGGEVLHGPFQEYFATGAKKSVGAYEEGLRVGDWQGWHENGNPASQARYEKDVPVGKYLEWHPNGDKAVEGTYVAGNKDGDWITWYSGGIQASSESWDNGTPKGDWYSWYDSGRSKSRGSYVNGRKEGRWVTFHDNGAEQLNETYVGGRAHGQTYGLYRTKVKEFEGQFDMGLQSGTWTWWHPNSEKLREGAYHTGRKTGLWREWYPDGTLSGQGEYQEDARNGEWVEYDTDGSVSVKRQYSAGMLSSEEYYFRDERVHLRQGPDGRRGRKAEWTVRVQAGTDVRHGIWREFHDDGVVALKGYFVDGLEDGVWRTYDAAGNLLEEEQWHSGKRIQ